MGAGGGVPGASWGFRSTRAALSPAVTLPGAQWRSCGLLALCVFTIRLMLG